MAMGVLGSLVLWLWRCLRVWCRGQRGTREFGVMAVGVLGSLVLWLWSTREFCIMAMGVLGSCVMAMGVVRSTALSKAKMQPNRCKQTTTPLWKGTQ